MLTRIPVLAFGMASQDLLTWLLVWLTRLVKALSLLFWLLSWLTRLVCSPWILPWLTKLFNLQVSLASFRVVTYDLRPWRMLADADFNTPSQQGRHSLQLQVCHESVQTSPTTVSWLGYQLPDHLLQCTLEWSHFIVPYLWYSGTSYQYALIYHETSNFLWALYNFDYRKG